MVASVTCFIQILVLGIKIRNPSVLLAQTGWTIKVAILLHLPMLEDARVVKTSRGRILYIAPVRRRVVAALEENGASSAQALRMQLVTQGPPGWEISGTAFHRRATSRVTTNRAGSGIQTRVLTKICLSMLCHRTKEESVSKCQT